MDKKCEEIKGAIIREYCCDCSNNCDREKCCELKDYDKICGSCNDVIDECECNDIRRKSQVIHKNVH